MLENVSNKKESANKMETSIERLSYIKSEEILESLETPSKEESFFS